MIDAAMLPSWAALFARLSLPEPKRGRARCPIHGGDSPYSLSLHESKGFHCFVCHAHGDKVDFIKTFLGVDFKAAMQWLCASPDRSSTLNPESRRQQRIEKGFAAWAKFAGRQFRNLHRIWFSIEGIALKRLAIDPDDRAAGALEYQAQRHCDVLAEMLDRLDSNNPAQWLAIYRYLHRAQPVKLEVA